jgi:hypothetical protein
VEKEGEEEQQEQLQEEGSVPLVGVERVKANRRRQELLKPLAGPDGPQAAVDASADAGERRRECGVGCYVNRKYFVWTRAAY